MPSDSAIRSPKSTQEDDDLESHPLFLTRVPSHKDFENNPLLSALAALIDEDDTISYKPVRRQRTHRRVDPCKRQQQLQSESPIQLELCSQERRNTPVEVSNTGMGLKVSDECSNEEERSGTSEGGVDINGRQALPLSNDTPPCGTSGLGELQICMRLWSMK